MAGSNDKESVKYRRSKNKTIGDNTKILETEPVKRNSRKRSLSKSSLESSSSSSTSEDEQRRKKRRKKSHYPDSKKFSKEKEKPKKHKRNHKKKKRSNRSPSSSSTDDRKSRKKRKSKKEKKSKKVKVKGVVDQNKYGAYGIIRESDLFVKQQEFYAWLQEVKNVNPETLPKFEMRKVFEDYMEDYNTATLPHKKYYDLEKWEAKVQRKHELKALKKARETSFSIVDDEKQHDMLHRRTDSSKYAGPSRQQLLEMQQELRRRQDEEYKKKAGLT